MAAISPPEPLTEPSPGTGKGPAPRRGYRAMAWARRRRALSGFSRSYRRSIPGMIGLVVLSAFILIAVFAPLSVDETQFDLLKAPGRP